MTRDCVQLVATGLGEREKRDERGERIYKKKRGRECKKGYMI